MTPLTNWVYTDTLTAANLDRMSQDCLVTGTILSLPNVDLSVLATGSFNTATPWVVPLRPLQGDIINIACESWSSLSYECSIGLRIRSFDVVTEIGETAFTRTSAGLFTLACNVTSGLGDAMGSEALLEIVVRSVAAELTNLVHLRGIVLSYGAECLA